MAHCVVQMDGGLLIQMEDGLIETTRPEILQNGAIVLDRDEDGQIAVYEDGTVTDWALSLLK